MCIQDPLCFILRKGKQGLLVVVTYQLFCLFHVRCVSLCFQSNMMYLENLNSEYKYLEVDRFALPC